MPAGRLIIVVNPVRRRVAGADRWHAPRVLTRASDQQIVWRWDYADPFGLTPPDENPSGLGTFTYNLRFPGQVFDKETTNHYNYFRDYDPQLGRYIQSDPIGLNGGINTYGYVNSNPLLYGDPNGEQLVQIGLTAVAIGGGAYAWYKLYHNEAIANAAMEAYARAARAYADCLHRQASGTKCDCSAEDQARRKAYTNLVGSALDSGKAANGVFPGQLPVGAAGNLGRPGIVPGWAR